MSAAATEPFIIKASTLDEELRQELAAIEYLLSREALWQPVDSATPFHDPRPMFYRRLEELQRKLSVTKITTLTGYEFENDSPHRPEALTFFGADRSDIASIRLGELMPPDGVVEGVPYDFEITVTVRPHVAGPKSKEGDDHG